MAFQRLYGLYEEELYSSAHTLAKFLLTNPSHFHISSEELFGSYCLDASS